MTVQMQDRLKVLDQTRQRLVQITQSLGSLVSSINQNDPLPPWSSLHSQASILSSNLLTISRLLHENRDSLSSLVAYPTPEFPGRTEGAMLGQLMRTKLEPKGEEWIAKGRRAGNLEPATMEGKSAGIDTGAEGVQDLTVEELQELWQWAPLEANQEARRRSWGAEYTIEEKEMGLANVVTGLRRKLEEEESEESDEEGGEGEESGGGGDEMEIVGVHRKPSGGGVEFDISREANHVPSEAMSHAAPLDDVFRFMMTGAKRR